MRIKSLIVIAVAFCMFLVPKASVLADACSSAADTCDASITASFERCITSCDTYSAPEDLSACKDVCDQQNLDEQLACDTQFQVCKAQTASFPANSGGGSSSTGKIVSVINPLGITDPRTIIGNLISAILSVVGSVTLLMFVYGGVLWITSMGNDKTVAKGKAVLVWTTIGLVIIAGAYTLTNAVITGLTTGQVVP